MEDKRFEYALEKFLSNRDGYCGNNELFGRSSYLDGLDVAPFNANSLQDLTVTSSHDRTRLHQAHR